MYVRCVHVRDDHALIAFEVLRELQTDLVRGLEVQRIVGGEGLDDVIIAATQLTPEMRLSTVFSRLVT